jgi:N-acyl-D-amino-acid deacylase
MQNEVRKAMEAGAFGMSTGLVYAPQSYAKIDEIISVAKIVGDFKGLYATHMRSEGKLIRQALNEMIEIVQKSGCAGGHISHHKISGKIYWGTSHETLRLIEDANARGISITYDSYPYTRGLTTLSVLLPPWVHEEGTGSLSEKMADPQMITRIKAELSELGKNWDNIIFENQFDSIYIASANTIKWKKFEGYNIPEITKLQNNPDDWTTFFNLVREENGAVSVLTETMGNEDMQRIMKGKYQMFGTDGIGMPFNPLLGKLHPRYFGTYPRVLGKFVREEHLLTMEDAIRRMTSMPAQRLGLHDRGTIKENMWADLVIFDPSIVGDKATYENPFQASLGISYVLVNGVIVVNKGKQKHKYPGRVLRKEKI